MSKPRIVRFEVPGKPMGKPRHRRGRNKKTGQVFEHPDPKGQQYEGRIADCFLAACGERPVPHDGPVCMTIDAYFPAPKSKPKWWHERLSVTGIQCMSRPDADNIVKVVCDALQHIAFSEDAHVTSVMASKWHSERPRLEVELRFYPTVEAIRQEAKHDRAGTD